MAITTWGWQGTVGELQRAKTMAAAAPDSVGGTTHWQLSQGTGRQVVAAPGIATAADATSELTSPGLSASLATPTNGQFYAIVRRVNWSTKAVTLEAVAADTTSTTTPTAAPTTLPTLNAQPGVLYDHFLGWAWVNSANTNVVIFDRRTMAPNVRLAAIESRLALQDSKTGTATARDSYYGTPSTTAQRAALAGAMWFRSDTKIMELYNGTAWVPWDSEWIAYTPTLGNVTIGNGTLSARYRFRAGVCAVEGSFTFGSTSALSAAPRISHPVTADAMSGSDNFPLGLGTFLKPTVAAFMGYIQGATTAACDLRTGQTGGGVLAPGGASSTVPFTWATGDKFMWRYEFTPA